MTTNSLLDHIIQSRNGHYCHALELDSAYAYECVIEQIVSDYKETFTQDDIIGFFDTISLYYYYDADNYDDEYKLSDEQQEIDENELYNFDYKQFIIDCY
ncbi:Hypothetical protein DAL_150 [Psychrobacter phage D'Alembert]|nr:Hypothetical protein DAL_7 [Psychrobacter phage D'Alembert]CAH1193550.1 Hypothetical protein DAL_150 [Psychrobacter phage D'Alembert]